MTDQTHDKTELEKSRDIITQLKEMLHFSKENIEKLTEIWLILDGEIKHKDMSERVEALILQQNSFHDALDTVVSDYEIECNRIENEGS